jgi:hypothetical protein
LSIGTWDVLEICEVAHEVARPDEHEAEGRAVNEEGIPSDKGSFWGSRRGSMWWTEGRRGGVGHAVKATLGRWKSKRGGGMAAGNPERSFFSKSRKGYI